MSLGNSGSFSHRRRLDDRPRRKEPLKKEESALMQRLRKQVPRSGAPLGRQGFQSAPKVPELPPGYIYAKGAAVGDRIACTGDGDEEIVGEVVG